MKRVTIWLFGILLGMWFPQGGDAQTRVISGNFENTPFPVFARKIDSSAGYHFYYPPGALDSLRVHLKIRDLPITAVLDSIFSTTSYKYAIDATGHIFITEHRPLRTTLSPEFFSGTSNTPADTAAPGVEGPRPEISKFVENKLFPVGTRGGAHKGTPVLSGYVRDYRNGEAISGASVYIDSVYTGVVSDPFGYYAVTVKPGIHSLEVTSLGMEDALRHIMVYSDGKLDLNLRQFIPSLKTVIVTTERRNNIRSTQMGIDRLSARMITQVPVVFGESDILKVVLTLPGVTSVGEAGTGFNVRGGATDQNLILFDGATIYNPSHLLGFFSAFNSDIIKSVSLYKSVIPVQYGGRLSSVLDVETKDGDNKKISGSGGIGLLTSKFMLEGPIKKGKTTFVLGARSSYSNWLLQAIPNPAYQHSRASFYDANLHLSHTFNANNNLYLTGYLSHDDFRFNGDTTYRYGNRDLVLKWKHIYSDRLYSVIQTGIDHYQYRVSSQVNPVNDFKLSYGITQSHLGADFNFQKDNRQHFNFGISGKLYNLHPGSYLPYNASSLVTPEVLASEHALESAVYFAYGYNVTSSLSVNSGFRYSLYNYLGPQTVNQYLPGVPRQPVTQTGTTSYASGKIIKTYSNPELRVSLRYALAGNASLKAGYNMLTQYIHQLSSTITISPTDIWKLSDPYIRPETGVQYSLGFYKNFRANNIETSVEVYYKRLNHMLDFKSGATLLMNSHLETDVIDSRGKAYGVELMIKKLSGKLNGWLTYTYSRSFLKSDDPQAGETINHGQYYPSNYDKPHAVNLVGNFEFTHRLSLSVNTVYSTGRPITLPIAVFDAYGAPRLLYSDRNAYRIPDYIRTDISLNLQGNARIHQALHNSWTFGVYNVFARKNVYSAYFVSQNGMVKGYQLSIFGTAIPFISYNFKF